MTPAERTALQQRLIVMSDQDVARAYNDCEPESDEADVIAEFMRARNVDL